MSNTNLPSNTGNNSVNPIKSAGNIMSARNSALSSKLYSARVTRKNPCAIVILIDQSLSMQEEFKNGITRAQAVSDIVNDLFDSLIMKCQKEGGIRDYFQIMVVGYGEKVSIIWEGKLENNDWVSVTDLKDNILKIETTEKPKLTHWGETIMEKVNKKTWVNPCSSGLTPMYEALKMCKDKLEDFVYDNQESFPPMIFNITDGYPTDVKDLSLITEICSEIKSIKTNDGNALIFNCLITNGDEMLLPSVKSEKCFEENEYHEILFQASSNLPFEMKNIANQVFQNERFINDEIKGVIINSTINSLINLLNIGTNTALSNAAE
ncbi:vWA domain-containing protein [Flavobacterium aciduliphilum]|uniref:VWFA domain-containing protein n=1 Tax=Flavobacterium aciduliphilum TaxID=1101402 RepID=A0A328YLZ5_9FLAO|nr:vWA domain-containing protein [Flavobacterium aciduliphilum]RAR73855.1 hypothetical protein CLV55_103174 [Flavobacterium aciduliphilum]